MSTKTEQGGATSTRGEAAQKQTALATQNAPEVAVDDPGDVGQLQLSLSQETLDAMSQELRQALKQVADGFGELTAPGKIYEMDQPFDVVDGFTIYDYIDRKTGEEKVKHIFRLEFEGGIVKNVMQSDARPRRVLARSFVVATGLGAKLRQGPFKYEKKTIPGQIQPAFIFVQQPGFVQRMSA